MPKMEKDVASKMVRACLSMGDELNALHLFGELLPDEQRKAYRRHLGEVMGAIYTRIMIPIIREYPDLDPDGPWLPSDENQNGEA